VNGFLEVRQNRVHGVTTTPRNHQVQKVDMSAQLALELEALRRRQPAQCLAAGVELPPIIGYWRLPGCRRRPMAVLSNADQGRAGTYPLPRFTAYVCQPPHSARRVTGLRPRPVGHASIQITVDMYGHLVPGGNRAAVDRLDDPAQPCATSAQPDDVSETAELPQVFDGPPGDRTRDTLIKSQVLYH
jgi:integrase